MIFPCFHLVLVVLKLHSTEAAYIARHYRLSTETYTEEPNPSEHGWTPDSRIRCIYRAFPEEVELLLVDKDEGETIDSNSRVDVLAKTAYSFPSAQVEYLTSSPSNLNGW